MAAMAAATTKTGWGGGTVVVIGTDVVIIWGEVATRALSPPRATAAAVSPTPMTMGVTVVTASLSWAFVLANKTTLLCSSSTRTIFRRLHVPH